MVARRLLALGVAAVLLAAAAATAAAAPPAALAARIDGEPLYAFTVDTQWQQRRAGKAPVERRAVLDELVLQRLLAARAEARAPAQQRASQVAFAPEVMLEERLAAMLREVYGKEIDAAVGRLPGATLDGLVTARPALPVPQLEALFGKPGTLKLEIAWSPEQQSAARGIEVLRYRLPGAEPAAITLFDVYRRQNVQGRLALSQHPASIAAQQALHILDNAFVLRWAGQRFGAAALADLRNSIAEGEAVAALQRQYGVGLDTDAGSALLNRLADETTPAEIADFYGQHQDLFARIERVRARHIRLADEAQARRAAKALLAGAGFAATARSMSRAPDAAKGGDLGWISADGGRDWLASIAFSQEPGKPSVPIRAPVGPNQAASWEIVLVEERVQGSYPLHSETVRYQASRLIAARKAKERLGEIVEQARNSARIDVVEEQ